MDAVVCPHCGKPRPEKGWAKPTPAGGPVAGLVGLALIGAIVWGVFSLFSGGSKTQSKAPAWVPQIGHRADLKKGFVVCDSAPALNTFLSEFAKAHAASDAIGESDAILRASNEGCHFSGSGGSDVLVIDASGVITPLFRIRMPSGEAVWTIAASLEDPKENIASHPAKPARQSAADAFPVSGPGWLELKPQQGAYLSNDGGGDTTHLTAYKSERDLAAWCNFGSPESVTLTPGQLVTISRVVQSNTFGASGGACPGGGIEISLNGAHYWVEPVDLIPVFPIGATILLKKTDGSPDRSGNVTVSIPKGTEAQIVRQDEGIKGQSSGDLLVKLLTGPHQLVGKEFWVDSQLDLQNTWWIEKRQ
jgi:hypothetical protein